MAITETSSTTDIKKHGRDVGFALGIITILSVLFLPIPPFLIDIGLAHLID